jgi:hypothetical protein
VGRRAIRRDVGPVETKAPHTAKLTPFGRRLLVDRIRIEGWPPATAADMLGVSRATAYKWLGR